VLYYQYARSFVHEIFSKALKMTFTCLFWFILTCGLVFANTSPKIEEFNHNRSQNHGTKFKISCSLQEGARPLHFTWHKNGELLQATSASTYRIETTDDDSLLIVDKLSLSDSANYSCSVRNHFGTDTQFTILVVKGLHLTTICFKFASLCGAYRVV